MINWPNKRLKRICYSDEAYLFAEQFRIQWVRKNKNEIVEEKYWNLKKKFKGKIKIFVWAIISSEGPLDMVIVNGHMDSDTYIDTLQLCPNVF